MKKAIIALLCLTAILLPSLASCSDGNSDISVDNTSSYGDISKGDESKDEIQGYNPETGKYEPDLPEYKWEDEKEFKVLVYSNTVQSTYFSEDIEPDLYKTTDEALNSAVAERNNLLYERYGKVSVKAYCVDDVGDELRKEISAGGLSGGGVGYDAAMPFLGTATTLAQSKYFYPLNDYSEYIDFNMPWWDQNFIDTMILGDNIYFAVGDISIMQKIVSSALVFNKPLLEDVGKGKGENVDIYQEVREGKWTFDRMYELSKEFTEEYDGVSGMTYKDRWGLSAGAAGTWYLASGETLVKKDADGIPYMYIGTTERSVTVAQKLISRFAEKDTWRLCHDESDAPGVPVWQIALDVFGENRALFYNCSFSAVKKLRNYKDLNEWGFLPFPKYDEQQEKYYSTCSATWAYGITIPVTASDPEFSAFMIEAMAAEAKNTITPAYYETVLKGRDTKDLDSEEMLDKYIFANIQYDIGGFYNFGRVADVLGISDPTALASKLDSIKNAVTTDIDKLLETYDK